MYLISIKHLNLHLGMQLYQDEDEDSINSQLKLWLAVVRCFSTSQGPSHSEELREKLQGLMSSYN